VLARDELAARARAVEARLSDALHGKLTERFINRRTAVLMRKLGTDAGLLSVKLEDQEVLVEGEHIGSLRGFAFHVDPGARLSDRKLLLAAAERHLPGLLERRASELVDEIQAGQANLRLEGGAITLDGERLARLAPQRPPLSPQLEAERVLDTVPAVARKELMTALDAWLVQLLQPLGPLRRIEEASRSTDAGPELRALLIALVEGGGMLERVGSGLDRLDKERRMRLARLGVKVGTLDIFVPAMLRPEAVRLWSNLSSKGGTAETVREAMPPALDGTGGGDRARGYRSLGKQQIRLDMAEKLLREAHALRVPAGRRPFLLDPARAISMGLTVASFDRLLRLAGFQPIQPRNLSAGAYGPPSPVRWRWRPTRPVAPAPLPVTPPSNSAFAALSELVR
jgi:ATP-dependent RNA helicase SUPV3L1/SUV3